MGQRPHGKYTSHTPHPITDADIPWILDLNRQFQNELSPLTQFDLSALVSAAFYARAVAPQEGFLLAFDQDADYGSPNFRWFRQRLPRFIYVDRITIGEPAQGRGLARHLYLCLFEHARAAGHVEVTCEVNIDPPNPASDAFHAGLNFTEMGRAKLNNGKSVRYLKKVL